MSPLRVVFLSEAIPPLSDGVTRTLGHLFQTLEAEGVDFRVVSGVSPDRVVPWRHRVHKVLALPFAPYAYYKIGIPLPRQLDAALDRFQPQLVHAVNPTLLGLYAIRYARRRHLPVVSSYHTNFVSYLPYYGLSGAAELGWAFLRWFYNRCDATYAPTRQVARELTGRGIRRVELWERGIDTVRFSPRFRSNELRSRVGANGEVPLVVYVGRLVREKDLDDLVQAAELLSADGHAFRLALVGDGPMRGDLERRLPDAVIAGYQHGDELARWYASADLLVLPSTTETFGNVILEANASGVPAVGVASGGVRDVIQPGVNGLLARPRDPRDLADQIGILIRDRALRAELAEKGLRSAAGRSWASVNRQLLASYDGLVMRRAA